MARLPALGIALIAAAFPPALAQDDPPQPPVPAAAAVHDVDIEVGGIRARLVLKRGSSLEGLLPMGTSYWEKPSPGLDYQETDASDPAAGLRLYFVLGMEGSIFFRKAEISEVKDLGVLSDEAAAGIRRELIEARRRALEEKEALLKESLRKILGTDKVEEAVPAKPSPPAPVVPEAAPVVAAPAPAPAPGTLSKEEEAKVKAEARRRRGEELLARYPPPDWSEKRLGEIQWREQSEKIPPDDVEAVFVRENEVWLEAVRRKEAAEKKAASPPVPPDAGRPAPR